MNLQFYFQKFSKMDADQNLDALLSALSDDDEEEDLNDSFEEAICNLVDDEISKLEDPGTKNVLDDSKADENKTEADEEPKINSTSVAGTYSGPENLKKSLGKKTRENQVSQFFYVKLHFWQF